MTALRLIRIVLPILLILGPAVSSLYSQSGKRAMLTGGSVKEWRPTTTTSMSPSTEGGKSALVQQSIIFNRNGTFVSKESDFEVLGNWTLTDDGAHIIYYNRSSGNWSDVDDSLIADVLDLSETNLVLEYKKGPGFVRTTYEPAEDQTAALRASFEPFWSEFKKAVKKNDKKRVADMTVFPFFSYDLSGFIGDVDHGPTFTRKEFLKYYDKLFDKRAKYLISVSEPTPMLGDESLPRFAVGIRSTGSSTIWIEFSRSDAGVWKLIRTDNVSYDVEEEEVEVEVEEE